MTTKKCSRCRRILPLSGFHRDKSKPDGHYTICKSCRAGITGPPEIPEGYRQCRICDKVKPYSEYYKAREGATRHTCIDCCEARWSKSYKTQPGRFPRHFRRSLLSYLSKAEQRTIARSNPEIKERDQQARRRYEDSAKGKEARRRWKENNTGYFKIYEQARRARKNHLTADFTEKDWAATLAAFGHHCVYCGGNGEPLHQDHWIPLSKGGPYSLGNIVPACKPCNSAKRNKYPSDFCDAESYVAIEKTLRSLEEMER